MSFRRVFADLHIHIGRTESGLPVKISAARNLTFHEIVREAAHRKGMDMIGIIDAHSPPVQEEIARGLETGIYREDPEGGIIYDGTTAILGAEIEVKERGMGPAHLLAYFPTFASIRRFTDWLSRHMKNVRLSTQRLHRPVRELQERVAEAGGLLIPAHVFTPFKSVYGSATDRMSRLLDMEGIIAVGLGLSADTSMADHLYELSRVSFVTNSDAHSLGKIGREYNELSLRRPSFRELELALRRSGGRRVSANYGLNPKLGKYYRTRCTGCGAILSAQKGQACPHCGGTHIVKGVSDRIAEIADGPSKTPAHRPPYVYQVPLEFIPQLGPKTLERLLQRFGTEMNVLHKAPIEEVADVAGEVIAHAIRLARERRLEFEDGGGGTYGKVRVARQPGH
jgi:uncharacterized protein (TIGR00375 family)